MTKERNDPQWAQWALQMCSGRGAGRSIAGMDVRNTHCVCAMRMHIAYAPMRMQNPRQNNDKR